jgi:hypothetical protein
MPTAGSAPPTTARSFRLGRAHRAPGTKTLKLRGYLTAPLPPPPPSVDWQSAIPQADLNPDGNDQYGDCVEAGKAHQIEGWTFNSDPDDPVNIPPATVVSDYLAETGGQDTGLVIANSLQTWQTSGMPTGLASPETVDKIDAYAELEASDLTQLQQVIAIFGGSLIGLDLPDYVLDQPLGQPWALPATGPAPPPNPSNGHCVVLLGYDSTYFYCVTWGVVTPIEPAFLTAYMDEAWAAIDNDWLESTGSSPSGLELAQLQSDLSELGPQPSPSPAPGPASCAPFLDKAEQEIAQGDVFDGIVDLFRYIECVIAGGTGESKERHAAFLERIRRAL